MSLLDPSFLARLGNLEIALRRPLPSTLRGDRRSPLRKGISLEFADFRSYAPGDDVRHLDWATLARLDQLVMRLYHDEEDVQISILVDDSASMGFGDPSKALFARQVAAALAWIGLARQTRVGIGLLGDTPDLVRPTRDLASYGRIAEKLEGAHALGKRALHDSCRDLTAHSKLRGVLVLVSDLLDPEGPAALLRSLQRPETELTIIHVLARDEVEPALEGDLRLIDAETGVRVEVSLTPSVLEAYRRRARSFIGHCAEVVRRRGAAYVHVTSDVPLEELFLRRLLDEGVLQ